MQCLSCGFENPQVMKFCIECGVSLKTHYPQCGFENLPRECGPSLTQQIPASSGMSTWRKAYIYMFRRAYG
jgi:hypothetical protein